MFFMKKKLLWVPSKDCIKSAQMWVFLRESSLEFNFPPDYESLYDWSTRDFVNFWNKIWNFCNIISHKKGSVFYASSPEFKNASFFPLGASEIIRHGRKAGL